jgi:ketosteroid isomerase-like protein
MSAENVEVLRALNEDSVLARRGGDFDPEGAIAKMAELWDPEIELDASEFRALDVSGVYRGVEAAAQWWRDWYSAWEALRYEYELIDAGDRVVLVLDMMLRGRSTGLEFPTGKVAWLVTFRDGLIVRLKLYMRPAEALEAAGVSS